MPKPEIFRDLLDYFQAEADQLSQVIKQTKINKNKPDSGSLREDKLLEFINRHIPTRCNISKGGFIFDLKGNHSKQIDLLITGDATLQFKTTNIKFTQSFNCIEGCYCAISVKTRLTKEQLIDSIDNLASIPTYKKLVTNSQIKKPKLLLRQIPQRVIFAYDGIDDKTILPHLLNYLNKKDYPLDVVPNLIIVNNSYFLSRTPIGGGYDLKTHKVLSENSYNLRSKTHSKYVGGEALLALLTHIQKAANIGSKFDIDYDLYRENIIF